MQRLETSQPHGTQLEIPPISLARYLDLLKRRRWQVVPISITGLLVGLIAALLIPRFYVAETAVEYRGDLLDLTAIGGPRRDPMAPIVSAAQIRIPYLAEEAAERLGWPEATSREFGSRAAFFRALRDRITVEDRGPGGLEERRLAHLRITYRDTDGPRARAFVEALREAWIDIERRELQQQITSELHGLNEQIRVLTTTESDLRLSLQRMEQEHGMDPQDRRAGVSAVLSRRTEEAEANRRRIAELEGEIEVLRMREQELQTQLDEGGVPRRVPRPIAEDPVRRAAVERLARLEAEMQLVLRIVEGLTPLNQERVLREAQAQALRLDVEELRELLGRQQEQEMEPNPAYETLVERRQEAIAERRQRVTERTQLLARNAELETQLAALQQIFPAYGELQDQLAEVRERHRDLSRDHALLNGRLARVANEEQFRVIGHAHVPSAPTEPNVTLVALAGSAIGLAFAIGLILLLDTLRFTFKTVDDVERGLPLPVLGGLSHMETIEERAVATHKRRRIAVVTIVFLVLIIALVTIYYVAPHRLPGFVVEALDVLLGAQK